MYGMFNYRVRACDLVFYGEFLEEKKKKKLDREIYAPIRKKQAKALNSACFMHLLR